ncbi:methionine--tRNA ligase [Chloroflexia bacterium SDU3-3]|nr:methionine--tRNA ligase [Chloroflexia bacterium SDU3-3]
MPENIHVSVAWPYANGPFHVGHIAGAYLPADIFARFQRLRGNNVLMVSGSDCHGTPITLKAEQEGIPTQDVIRRYHTSFLQSFVALGISFDLFTQTYTDNHYAVTTDIFLHLQERGYIYKQQMVGSYSETLGRFLPDREVEGTCPHCGFASARGDQCDNCGKLLDPQDLVNPRAKIDGKPISFRDTEHYFLDLAKLEPTLRAWLDSADRSYWRPNTVQFTTNWLHEGLRGRAITRDLEWGVPVPVDEPEFKDKRIYVWFDAVIGYLSASVEWAKRVGRPDAWKEWWVCGADGAAPARAFYFIGKDNIPFHTIIWPAMLLGYGERTLPYDVPANEFLNLEGEKMSTSRNWALWSPDIESRYQPDQIRFYLTAAAPEGRDSNWYWSDFVQRNNAELVANWGNLANRVLNIAHKNFGAVPTPGELAEADKALLADVEAGFQRVTELLDAVKIKQALTEALQISQRVNQYLAETTPWKLVKEDRERAATVLFASLRAIDTLKVLFTPFLPHSSQQLHELLGYSGVIAPLPHTEDAEDKDGGTRQVLTGDYQTGATWAISQLPAGQAIHAPTPLFRKLEEAVVEEELARLRSA